MEELGDTKIPKMEVSLLMKLEQTKMVMKKVVC